MIENGQGTGTADYTASGPERPSAADAEAILARYAGDPEVVRYLGWPGHELLAETRAFLAFRDSVWSRWPPVRTCRVARWRQRHPRWKPGQGWDPVVASTCVETDGEVLLLDPLAPPVEADHVWGRWEASPPTAVVVLKPDHVRDVDSFVRRYRVRAFGPDRFDRHDIPDTELEPVFPGSQLPGGVMALYDGRGRNETPLWLPRQRVIVFADALTAPDGVLRIWGTPWHEERVVPALRQLLELPFELVVVSHGEPVHTRADFERALLLPAWTV